MTNPCSNNTTMIGVDVAKDKLDICILPTKSYQTIANDTRSIRSLCRRLKKQECIGMVVMEHTGGYEKLAHRIFVEESFPAHLGDPTRIHYFAKQKGYFAKTDHVDAHTCAQYGLQENVQATPVLDKTDSELKELSGRRGQLVTQLAAEKCRFKPHLSTVMQRTLKHSDATFN